MSDRVNVVKRTIRLDSEFIRCDIECVQNFILCSFPFGRYQAKHTRENPRGLFLTRGNWLTILPLQRISNSI